MISRAITFLSDELGATEIGFLALVVRAAPIGGTVMIGQDGNYATSSRASDRHGIVTPTG